MVLNIDLAPTLLEAAGLAVPNEMEGASLVPILESSSAQGRRAWLYEYFKDFPYNVPPILAVRTETHIYIEYGSRRPPELFDLIKDPRPMENLAGSPEGARYMPALKEMLKNLAATGRP
jgi:N-acetylglucosamine-6-sulfatase